MTPPSSVASLFLCLLVLLLPAQHGATSHASFKPAGSRQFFFKTPGKSSGNSRQASTVPPATTCSPISTGLLGKNKLSVVHRQSPCSPLHGLPSLTTADVLRRDATLIQRRFSSQSSLVASSSPAATTIPANVSSDLSTVPGALDYIVLISYGTPEQQFPVLLDTSGIGTSLLRCQPPCASSSDDGCDDPAAFETSQSSTFAHVPCGSPDCPANCSGSSAACPFDHPHSTIEGTFAQDVLTLSPSMAVNHFRFVCQRPEDLPVAGTLDLSRDGNSLPSRLAGPAAATATFSYCLPPYPSSQGFLSLGGDATLNVAVHAPLVSSGDPRLSSMYLIDVVGMRLGGEDLPIPASTFRGNAAGAILDLGTTFTMLPPDAYAPLRDAYRNRMSEYNRSVPGFAGFDTCFNFTGVHELFLLGVEFVFSNGESLVIDGEQMLYYDDPAAGPFTMACLAFSAFDDGGGDVVSAVIGTYQLASVEVVYDVAGGNVGFIPRSC